jgi:hypothetical protein
MKTGVIPLSGLSGFKEQIIFGKVALTCPFDSRLNGLKTNKDRKSV